ncbi:Endonuclease-reverse transcriptase [Operophtera brumata]|uniref:Endonuclease-reverse transcriptase n=1 Tax=Operophtera brumata TaxID=104452 RepID=A0A0L7KM56_OPEBR|nr:Endonuclease-reverse transcriptase [Operophtera brumata]
MDNPNYNLQVKYNTLEKLLRETEQKTASVKLVKDKIGEEAKELIKKRQALRQQKSSTRKEISDISKSINQCIRKHRQKTRTDKITYHIESTGGVKKAWKELQENTDWISNMKDKKIKTQTKRSEILEVATDYYRGTNFQNWKFRLQLVLEERVAEAIKQEKPNTENAKEYPTEVESLEEPIEIKLANGQYLKTKYLLTFLNRIEALMVSGSAQS